MRSTRAILNEASPGKLPDANRLLPMGEAVALVPRSFRGVVTAGILTLPDTAKCAAVLSAFGQGTVPGYKTPIATQTALPATTECGPTPGGDIAFNVATDALTFAEVQYLAYEGTAVSDALLTIGTPVADQGVLLGLRGASVLLEANVLTGTAGGQKTIALRGTTPGAGAAAITEDGLSIEFAAADVALTASVTYIAAPGVGDAAQPVGTVLDAEDQSF